MKRRRAREIAVQTLYQVDLAKSDWKEALQNTLDEEQSDAFLEGLITGVQKNLEQIDHQLRQSLQHWKLERLSHVDRAILRLATYEIVCREDIPSQVAINEAVEVSKIYGTDESSKFINGVLSNILRINS